jgi:ABC-type glycerol-3-phosphate transport system substrate-binding protein
MKKVFTLITLLLFIFVIAACGKKPDNNNNGQVTITYASWNLGLPTATDNMERKMIEAFMVEYPNIKVEIVERPKIPGTVNDMGWNEFLATRASTETLPDVFMADDIPYYVINNWAYNLTTVANADPEFLNVSQDIRGVATYSGKVMALPNAVHYAGYVINKTLYANQGASEDEIPNDTTTIEQLIAVTEKYADHRSTTNSGVVGLEGIEHILHWYPAQLNTNYGWFTLTNEGFHLDSTEFAQTMDLYRNLQTNTDLTLEALQVADATEGSGIKLGDIFPEGDYLNNGVILAKWYYSYDFGWMQAKKNSGEYTWDLDFIGTPVVNGVKRVPIVADFFTVASNTKHPQEAYELAKWMGFGKKGYMKRVELSKTVTGISQVNFAPIQNDTEMLDAYFDLYPDFTGLRGIIENGTFIVEPPKYLPGYNDARYNGTYDAENKMGDIINRLRAGDIALADIKTQLNNRANELYHAARTQFDAAIAQR